MKILYTHSKTLSGYLMVFAMVMFTYSVNAQTNHDVTIVGNSFVPATLTIDVGDNVTFINDAATGGGGFHNINGTQATYPTNPDNTLDNGSAASGPWTYVWTCTAAGLYDYQCDPHAGGGMVGTITAAAACTAEAGTLTADASSVCLAGGSADISATEADAPVVPGGYTTLYVLTQGPGLVIINASATPAFTVTAADDYTIHTLVYDPTNVDPTTFIGATGFDVNDALVQGGGVICGALDVTGAPVTVEVCIGMQETLDAGLSIYPNPSSGNFLVTVNGVDANIILNVTDVAGRLVYTESATISNSYRNELNLDLADGSYLLSIVTEEGTVVRRIQVAK
jgi:plastocyanin